MSRYASVLLLFAGLAALVGAQAPSGLTPVQQAQLLARNRELLKSTVENSLELGEKTDHLERAGTCNRLIKVWASEVERAARNREVARAAELGGHLSNVVERGVANNLRSARRQIEAGSPMERKLFLRQQEALQVLQPLEDSLGQAAREQRDLENVRQSVEVVRRMVQDAVQEK